ncbi:MAG: ribosome recycling factor [Bacteroidales bacterium]|nr:ribosome recycling factor [Bacteroidales bacterium]
MNEEVEIYMDDAKDRMDKALNHLESELTKIRAGKASPAMLKDVKVDYYGSLTALTQMANVGTSDARTIVIQPWEKKMIGEVEKAILKANLGFNPVNNGEIIRIVVPELTEERRQQMSKMVKNEGENAKIAVRNIRRDTIAEIKQLEKSKEISEDESKGVQDDIQKITDEFTAKIDKVIDAKQKDIMSV